MDIEAVFGSIAELERELGDLYFWFSDLFADEPEAAFHFARMAADEGGHARLVDYQKRIALQNEDLLGATVDAELQAIFDALSLVRRIRSGPPPSLAAAVRDAVRLERSAAESHLQSPLRQVSDEFGRLLDCLAGEDEEHLLRLLRLAETQGIAADLGAA